MTKPELKAAAHRAVAEFKTDIDISHQSGQREYAEQLAALYVCFDLGIQDKEFDLLADEIEAMLRGGE